MAAAKYQPAGRARFTVERVDLGEQFRIPARRQIFVMLFLPLWLTGWTVGGIAAIYALLTKFEPFLVVWLCGWAVGWIVAFGTLAWMITGSETIRVTGRDLEVAYHALGMARRRLYQGSMIRHMTVSAAVLPFSTNLSVPLVKAMRNGTIRFDYGARTVSCGSGIDEAEARLIVEGLRPTLPRSAFDPATATATSAGDTTPRWP